MEYAASSGSGEDTGHRRITLNPWIPIGVVAAGVFLAALDQTMVVTVLPAILQDLRIPLTRLDDAAWVITGYLLGYTVAMPLFGRLADVYGRRLIYIVAVGIFAVGSLLCVLAGGLDTLVGARIFQAAGGGALVPVAMAVAASLVPLERRAFALGVIGGAAEAGGVLGPVYGASLTELWGWRSIFLVNVPLGLILIAACYVLLPKSVPLPEEKGSKVDYVGALLMAGALAGLTVGLGGDTQAGEAAVRPEWLAGSGLAFATFLLYEWRVHTPLINLSLFRRPAFTAANIAHLAVGAALIVGMVEIPLFAYSLLGSSEIEGGLLLIRLTALIPVGAVAGGWTADRIGYRATAAGGFLLTATGYWLVGQWSLDPSQLVMTRDLGLTGFGFGLVIAPIAASVISSVGENLMATGSALVTVMRMVGMMVGLTALSSWGIRRFNTLMADTPLPLRSPGTSDAQYDRLVESYQNELEGALHNVYNDFFVIAAVVCAAAVIPALFFPRRPENRRRLPFLPF